MMNATAFHTLPDTSRRSRERLLLEEAEKRRSSLPDSAPDLDAELQRLDGSLLALIDARDGYYRKSRKLSDGLRNAGLGIMAGGVLLGRLAGDGLAAGIVVGLGVACAFASAPVNMVLSAVLAKKEGQLAPLAHRRVEVARRRMEVAHADEDLRDARERYERVVGETQRLQSALSSRGGRVEDLGSAVRIGSLVLEKRAE